MTAKGAPARGRSAWVAAIAVGAALGAASPARAQNVVSQWDAALANAGGIHYHLAMMHVAIFDTVNAVDRRYKPFAVLAKQPKEPVSIDAAVSEAAWQVLGGLSTKVAAPNAAVISAQYATAMAAVPNGPAKDAGRALGAAVAQALLAQRDGDGWPAVAPADPPEGALPGEFQKTPPTARLQVSPWLANVRPFVLASAAQFRAPGPPALSSARYATDFDEVKGLGGATSVRTPLQTGIAELMTTPPFRFWTSGLRSAAAGANLDVVETARLFVLAHVANFDASVACWDSKYFYYAWRPYTAIRRADEDGNAGTAKDDSWTSAFVTPQHPEYPSAHGCAAGTFATVLEQYFGTDAVSMTFTGLGAYSPRQYSSLAQMVSEASEGRIWGGIHFRFATEDGVQLGHEVADYVLKRGFGNAGHKTRVNW